jgi:hypothetical protein
MSEKEIVVALHDFAIWCLQHGITPAEIEAIALDELERARRTSNRPKKLPRRRNHGCSTHFSAQSWSVSSRDEGTIRIVRLKTR